MGLTLPDVEAVLVVGDALKHDRLGVEKRVELHAPELADRIHDRAGFDVDRSPHAGKVADYLEAIGIRQFQGLFQDPVGIPVEPVDHDDLVAAQADVFDGDLAVGIDRKGFGGGWHKRLPVRVTTVGTSDLLHYRAHGCVVSSLNPYLSL